MSVSFKKFVEFVELDGDVSDEQITEIFGMFRNNDKLEKLKKEREKLKSASADKKVMTAQKKAELDQALIDFKYGKKPDAKKKPEPGAISDDDLESALDSRDRKFLAKDDRAKNQTGRNAYEAKNPTVKAFKITIPRGLTDDAIYDFIEDQSIVTIEDFTRKGDVVYLYPHFEHDYSESMAKALQSAMNEFADD